MEALLRTSNGKLTIKIESDTVKGLFEGIAGAQSVFDADTACGCCNSPNIGFRVREHEDNKYYELYCKDCAAQFSFGQHKKGGGLYAKTWDKENKRPYANRAWKIWGSFGNGGGRTVDDDDTPF